MTLAQATFDWVRQLVHERAAIVLEPGKEYLVEARLGPIAKALGFPSVDELVRHVRANPPTPAKEELTRELVEALTTNETSFFRDIHPFETLKNTVLPALIQSRASSRAIRIWCAAASTGQEPFSIAMAVREMPELASWDVKILATDINRAVLARAKTGMFRQLEVNRGLPAKMLLKYFDKSGSDWKVKPDLQRMVSFEELNLLERWAHVGRQDIVFMRNVLIYFDVPTKRQILRRVRDVLADDGALFLGGSETTMNIADDLVGERTGGPTTTYRRRPTMSAGFAAVKAG